MTRNYKEKWLLNDKIIINLRCTLRVDPCKLIPKLGNKRKEGSSSSANEEATDLKGYGGRLR